MPLAARHPCSACLAQTVYSGTLPTLPSYSLAATKGQLSSAAFSGDFSSSKLSSRGQSRMAEGHSLSSHLWLSVHTSHPRDTPVKATAACLH